MLHKLALGANMVDFSYLYAFHHLYFLGREDDEAPDGIQTPPLLRRKLKEILALPQEDLSSMP